MDSPPGVPESAGALDSMDGDGPSAPSGHGPQSPVDYATDASVSSLCTHGLLPEEFVPAPEARPAPWPLRAASPRPAESRSHKLANDGATNEILFNYPETPGRGAVRSHSGSMAYTDFRAAREVPRIALHYQHTIPCSTHLSGG
jgi:hypothetical protein